jgi:ADP-ribose pyrophosphatase
MRKSSGLPAKARVLSSREVYRGPAFWVTTDQVLEPSGIRVRRDIVHHTGSVVILAVEQRKAIPSVLLERQYRHAARRYLWELPAGRIDAGENPLAAAQRELEEETGYSARHWKRILHFWASPGFVAEAMSIYLARGLHRGVARPEPDEKILARLFTLPDAVRMVMRGTIRDAKTIAGVLWLSHQQAAKSRNR